MARHTDGASIIRWMEATPGAHSIKSIAEGMTLTTEKARALVKGLEDKGWLLRASLDPIQFRLAGCREVYDTGGLKVRCTTTNFHTEHEASGFKKVT